MSITKGHIIYNNQIVHLAIYCTLNLDQQQHCQQPPPFEQGQNNYCNFKLLIFSSKEEDNLNFRLETTVNKITLYEIYRIYWV